VCEFDDDDDDNDLLIVDDDYVKFFQLFVGVYG
jgi:hypothetical protein